MRILITGSRNWTDRAAIHDAIIGFLRSHPTTSGGGRPSEITIVHGGARGADTLAASVAKEWGMRVEEHPAMWQQGGVFVKRAGHDRNAAMVRAGAEVCLAFPLGESRGTRGCMRLAAAAGIPVIDHDPAIERTTP